MTLLDELKRDVEALRQNGWYAVADRYGRLIPLLEAADAMKTAAHACFGALEHAGWPAEADTLRDACDHYTVALQLDAPTTSPTEKP